LVESTIIPLELVFEHRNYLPSLFFFLPFSYGAVVLLDAYREKNKPMFYLIIVFLNSIIILIGFSTYLRNNDWRSHESLWNSALKTSSTIIRPYAQLGWSHTSSNRTDLDKAYSFFSLGLEKRRSYNIFEKALLWINISKTFEQTHDTEKSIDALVNSLSVFEEEIEKKPGLIKQRMTVNYLANIHYYLSNNYSYLNEQDKAITHINKALEFQKTSVFLNSKAKILIKQEKYSQALIILQASLDNDKDAWETPFLIGKTLTHLKFYSRGLWFYRYAIGKIESQNLSYPLIYLYLAENRYLASKDESGDHHINQFVKAYSIEKTVHWMKGYQSKFSDIPPFVDSLFIFTKLNKEILSMVKVEKNNLRISDSNENL